MNAHANAIDQAQITQLNKTRVDFLVGPLQKLKGLISKGTSITITDTEVIAHIGSEKFVLAKQAHELEADLEAVCRLSNKKVI